MLKQGYKQTEIGVIPEDWEVKSIKELTSFHKQGYYTKEQYKSNGAYYLLRGTDMQNPKIDLSTTPRLDISETDFNSYKVLKNDVLIVRSGAIGRYGINKVENANFIFGSYLINFRLKDNLVPEYFGCFYESDYSLSQIKAITQGGANLNINAENIKSLQIPLPPLSEQKAIASALSDADAWIESLEQLIAKKRLIKQGAMLTLLTPKEDWEVKKLGEVVEYVKGYPFRSKDYIEDGIRIIRISDTTYNSIKTEGGIYISEKKTRGLNKWKLNFGDLILSTVGSKPPMYDSMVGKVIYITKEFEGSFLNQNMVILRSSNKCLQIILANVFKSKKYLDFIESIYRGNANQASITLSELFEFSLLIPKSLSEQERIATILSDMDAELEALATQLGKARQIKQGMMQELLTGRTRLV